MNKVLVFDINKKNIAKLTTNEKSIYILGIGNTDYTIHREANNIDSIYNDEYNFFENFSISDKHQYHPFEASIKDILRRVNWKDNYRKKLIKKIYIGIPNITELVYVPYKHRSIDSISYIGKNFKEIEEKLKIIVELDE